MFGIFDAVVDTVENGIDVAVGAVTFGEYGDFSKRSVSKMIADGIEIAVIANAYDVGIDIIEKMIEDEG